MATIKGIYKHDLINVLTHCKSKTEITVDASSNDTSYSPVDMLCAALGSCMMSMMSVTAKNHDFSIDGATYEIEKVMADSPKRVGQINVTINFNQQYTEKQQALLRNAANTCPVKNSINKDIIVNVKMNYEVKS